MSQILDFFLKKMSRYSFPGNAWPLVMGTSSCAYEFWAAWRMCPSFQSNSHLNRFPPEQSDILIVYGYMNKVMIQNILKTYRRMPKTKKVMLIGPYKDEENRFGDTYWGKAQLTDYIEADVVVSGDPPLKEDILKGLDKIYECYLLELEEK